MLIKWIKISNFRAAKNLAINMHPQMNLFIGVNGAGKSTVLQAVALALTALVRRVNNSDVSRRVIAVTDINNSESSASIEIEAQFFSQEYTWSISRVRPGSKNEEKNNLDELVLLATALKAKFKESSALPVIAYYPVSRVVEKVVPSMGSRMSPNPDSLDIYDNALEGRPNFQNFFRWFRDQDDYVNQKSLSRSHWIKRNSTRLQWQISQIFEKIRKLVPLKQWESFSLQNERGRSFELIIHEPRFIFRELNKVMHVLRLGESRSYEIEKVFFELDYMLHRMDMLSSEGGDSLVDSKANLLEILASVLELMCSMRLGESKNKVLLDLLWSTFILSFELGLWWLSNEGHNHLIVELDSVDWPSKKTELAEFKRQIVSTVDSIIDSDTRRQSSAQVNFGRDIQNVTRAIEKFVPEYNNLRINRSERGVAQMLVDKGGQEFDIGQLSDGEKNLIALIGDIARRLTIGNPNSEDPLNDAGIILIDELDLHLHPKWQRIFSQKISEVFPGCQFIVSSHSPQVISHIRSESIIALDHLNGEIIKGFVNDSYGKSSDRILEDVMDETARPKAVDDKIKKLFNLIQNNEIIGAKNLVDELRKEIGEDSELIKATVLMKRREIIGK